jgi:hypothetical protein
MIDKSAIEFKHNSLSSDLDLDEHVFWLKYQATRNQVQKIFRLTSVIQLLNPIFRFIEKCSGVDLHRPIEDPIFLLGNFRSGTTFLESLLTAHPKLGYYTYLSQIFPLSLKVPFYLFNRFPTLSSPVPAVHQPTWMVSYRDSFECEAIWNYSPKPIFSDSYTHILNSDDNNHKFNQLLTESINSHLEVQKKSRFINKNPLCTLRIGYLAKAFPSALFVYLVRHPYRVLQSQLDLERMSERVFKGYDPYKKLMIDTFYPPRTFFRTYNYKEILETYNKDKALGVAKSIVDFDEEFDKQVTQEKLENRIIKMRYEDLMQHPQHSLERILTFTKLEDGLDSLIGILKEKSSPSLLRTQLPEFNYEIRQVLAPMVAKYGY